MKAIIRNVHGEAKYKENLVLHNLLKKGIIDGNIMVH